MKKLLPHSRRPDITFRHNGRISITSRVARILSIQPGDSINIALLDGETYLYAIHHINPIGRHIASCHPTKPRSLNFSASSVALCRAILSLAKVSSLTVSLMAGQPILRNNTTLLPLIIRHPIPPITNSE